MSRREDRGAALILALLVTMMLAGAGVSLVVVGDTERRVAANYREAQQVVYAADSAMERTIAELSALPDWSAVLAGGVTSWFADGTRRPRLPSGRTLDLDALTQTLQAGSNAGGTFGANTPVWRLFAWGPLSGLTTSVLSSGYLATWVADDPADADNDPMADGNGRLSIHAEAFGFGQSRRAVEAIVERAGAAIRIVALRDVTW